MSTKKSNKQKSKNLTAKPTVAKKSASKPLLGEEVSLVSKITEKPPISDSHGVFLRLEKAGFVIGKAVGKEVPVQGAEHITLPSGSKHNLRWSTTLRFSDLGGGLDVVETLVECGKKLASTASEKLSASLSSLPAKFPTLEPNEVSEISSSVLNEVLSSGRYTLNHLAEGDWPKDMILAELRAEQKVRQEEAALSVLQVAVDYPGLFRTARKMKRKIIAYLGPTNSGKTWHALNRLADAGSGAYLGPLRLLALEGQEEMFKRGCICSLITGEERDIIEGAQYVSSTVEMANLSKQVKCAVIDEIQMIADHGRGAAWVRAFVGMPAKELIVSGSADSEALLRQIAASLGEEIEFHHLARHSPLEVAKEHTAIKDIKPGTAIIAFSRAEVLRLRESLPPEFKAAVIYGNLSPEVRREEAARFRNGDAKVLVATDCIAYGLNLPIQYVLFHTHIKSIARQQTYLDDTLVKQIAGRAGRFGFFTNGVAGALNAETLRYIGRCLEKPGVALKPPLMTRPSWTEIEPIVKSSGPSSTLCSALKLYIENAKFNSKLYEIEPLEDMLALADVADRHHGLSIEHRFNLACAPATIDKSPALRDAFIEACAALAEKRDAKIKPPVWQGMTDNSQTLLAAEDGAKTYDLYLWLSWRFPDNFPDIENAEAWRSDVNKFISNSLKSGIVRRCTRCEVKLSLRNKFGICDDCYDSKH